jgi:DNA-binding transcriptional LysR family regulator
MDGRRDTIAGMEALVALADAGSFSAGARDLGLTPSAMSKLVTRLERRLGTQLVERTTRRMRLTEAGHGYYRRARGVLAAMDEAELELDGLRAAPRGLLRVSAPVPFGLTRVLPALTTFRARHPEVQVELDLSDRVVDLVEEGIDVAVRVTEAAPPQGVVARRLGVVDRVLCASPAYLQAHGTPRTVAHLASHDCLVLTSAATPRVWHLGKKGGAPQAVPVRGAIAVNHVLGLRVAALAGLGIAELARYLVADDLAAGDLVVVLPSHAPPARTAFALYQPSPWKPLKVRAFVRHLEATLGPRSR